MTYGQKILVVLTVVAAVAAVALGFVGLTTANDADAGADQHARVTTLAVLAGGCFLVAVVGAVGLCVVAAVRETLARQVGE